MVRLCSFFLLGAMLGGCSVGAKHAGSSYDATETAYSLNAVLARQEPVSAEISPFEAMARAIRYNLDQRVAETRSAFQRAEINLEHYSFLPSMVANAGYNKRSNDQASGSLNSATSVRSPSDSISQDRATSTGDVRISWNVLDFGLSYVRALQSADRMLIDEELKRKAKHVLIEDVQAAYWRAATYEKLAPRLHLLEKRTGRALANLKKIRTAGRIPRKRALFTELELTEIHTAAKKLIADAKVAKIDLARLMNVPQGTPFKLAHADFRAQPKKLSHHIGKLEAVAVQRRPDLLENWYQQRINTRQGTASLLELLPGVEAILGANLDSNSFLANSNWVNAGARASWNLLNVFRYPAKQRVVKSRQQLLKDQSLATFVAVLTQVHVSRARLAQSESHLKSTSKVKALRKDLAGLADTELASGQASEHEALQRQWENFVADIQYNFAYADYQSAYANLMTTIGWDLSRKSDQTLRISKLTDNLRSRWQGFDTGFQNINQNTLKTKGNSSI